MKLVNYVFLKTKKILLIVIMLFSSLSLFTCDSEENNPTLKKITFDDMEVKCEVLPQGIYRSIFFISNEIGYTSNNDGEIYYTIDSGNTWSPQISGTTKPLLDIFFLDQLNGFIVGGGDQQGIILKTIDGGANWMLTALTVQNYFNAVYFINQSTGFVVGQGILLKTINGGETWNEVDLGKPYNLGDIDFFDENVGLISGSPLLKTEDGGKTWHETNIASTGQIQVLNERVAFIHHFSNKTLKTTDGGLSWSEIKFNDVARELHFINEQQAIAGGQKYPELGVFPNGAIYLTNDGGQTWDLKLTTPPECYIFNAISFPNDSVGYAIGNTSRGCIAKFQFK